MDGNPLAQKGRRSRTSLLAWHLWRILLEERVVGVVLSKTGAVTDFQPQSTGPRSGPGVQTPAGWYQDPWNRVAWRWWDGWSWTANTSQTLEKKPRLPNWLSVPVLIAAVPMALALAYFLYVSVVAVGLGLVPLVIVVPVLVWLDRVEPEPWSSRIHALLWGVTVAAFVASIVNSIVAVLASESIAAVVSAPLIEEAMKAAGIVWAVRRKELDGVMDGIVYAGWVALGFAVIEDGLYFATAAEAGFLGQTFLVRAILTPFAHPLFTVWSGIAIGLAVSKGKPVFPSVLWGYAIAVILHATWNGSLTYAEDSEQGFILVAIAMLLFMILFFSVALALVLFRRREQQRFTALVPFLAHRYQLTPGEAVVFGQWRNMLRIRSSLSRTQRKHFDGVHSALARLALLHSGEHAPDPSEEQRLAGRLDAARRAPSS